MAERLLENNKVVMTIRKDSRLKRNRILGNVDKVRIKNKTADMLIAPDNSPFVWKEPVR
jgi:hypothetical protein